MSCACLSPLISDMRRLILASIDPLSLFLFRIARGLSLDWARQEVWKQMTSDTRTRMVVHPGTTPNQVEWLRAHRFYVDPYATCIEATQSGHVALLAYYYANGVMDALLLEETRIDAYLRKKNWQSLYLLDGRYRLVYMACRAGHLSSALWLSETLLVPMEDTWCWESASPELLEWWATANDQRPDMTYVECLTAVRKAIGSPWMPYGHDDVEIVRICDWFHARYGKALTADRAHKQHVLDFAACRQSSLLIAWARQHFPPLQRGDVPVETIEGTLGRWALHPVRHPVDTVLRLWADLWDGVRPEDHAAIRAVFDTIPRGNPALADVPHFLAFIDARKAEGERVVPS